ncbi:aminopeptidase P family protein [Candidatus Bathyarchaeota archaeon]|nr:MAG: aminopeptidase P family protein [Candidatus Bathyarchaeota archaeon]
MDQLKQRNETAVAESGYDAVLAVGVDNFNYITRTVLPFAENYPSRKAATLLPKEGTPVVIVPQDWSQALLDQGWTGEVLVYDENQGYETGGFVKAVEELIVGMGLDKNKIGIDTSRVSKGLMDSLSGKLPSVVWESADPMLRDLRIIKTQGEIGFIERACKQADRGIVYALMHLEGVVENPGYTIAEITERIRVHVNENGASGVGLLNSAFGSDGQIYYTPQKGWVKEGELFRMDVSAHYMGYWTNVGRMGVTGKPTPEQENAYKENLKLKATALEMLKPGVACNEVYAHVIRAAEKQAVGFWKEPGIGHGVGASHHEAPYLNLNCSTELKEGMVIALDIYTYGPRQELVHSKDVYAITEEGNRKLSWYKTWDKLYNVYGIRATH